MRLFGAKVNRASELDRPDFPVVAVFVESGHESNEKSSKANEIDREEIEPCTIRLSKKGFVRQNPPEMNHPKLNVIC